MPVPPVLLAIDGNSLLHRAFHSLQPAGPVLGEPVWAVRGLLTQIGRAIDRVGASAVIVGFDDPSASARAARYPGYKAHRADKPAELCSQLLVAEEVVAAAGLAAVRPDELEADDVLASAARLARDAGWRCVLVTSDRDAFTLVDDTTSVLRIINGGVEMSPLLTPERIVQVTGVAPRRYAELAALRGDLSDNLPGVAGIGPKIAACLLAGLGNLDAVLADAAAGGRRIAPIAGTTVAARLAEAETAAILRRNLDLMATIDSIPTGVDLSAEAGVGRLPGAETVVRGAAVDRIGWAPSVFVAAVCGLELAAAAPRFRPASYAANPPVQVLPPGLSRPIPAARPRDVDQGAAF
ncbi:MAG: 5'-3' exonuclease H3TH domain-containing protein [Mycobacteriales bacterium]